MSRGREERLEFDDYDDTPGKSWDDFKGRLMNYAAGRTDDRGWSLADHLMQVDEGSPGVPKVGLKKVSGASDLHEECCSMCVDLT